MKGIVVIHKDQIHHRPPVLSVTLILAELDYPVVLVTCGINPKIRTYLESRGVKVILLSKCIGATSIFNKLKQYYHFRLQIKHVLRQYPDSLLWIEGAPSILALWKLLKGKRDYVLQIQELHEESHRQLCAIGKLIHEARCVCMPEYNRTALYQVWFKLKKRPVVLPNKPYFIPTPSELNDLEKKYSHYVKLFKQKKVILYQGLIHKERDLSGFVTAIRELGDEYQLVLLGKDLGVLEKYQAIDHRVVHIDYISAPDYLLLTSLCYIGIVSYDPCTLNTTFCAPNKIYEYAAFGKPMIGNDIPGLKCVATVGAAILLNEHNTNEIGNAIKTIECDYATYSANAKTFFENTDNREIVKCILKIAYNDKN